MPDIKTGGGVLGDSSGDEDSGVEGMVDVGDGDCEMTLVAVGVGMGVGVGGGGDVGFTTGPEVVPADVGAEL